jgi:hypothetical protein
MKAGLLRVSMGSGIERVIKTRGCLPSSAREIAGSWTAGEKSTKNEVARQLQKTQLTTEDVMAETLEGKINSFEKLGMALVSARHGVQHGDRVGIEILASRTLIA